MVIQTSQVQVITVPSMTARGKSYQMCIVDGVVQSCSCPAYSFSKKHRSCKHMRVEQVRIENENEAAWMRYSAGVYDSVA